MQCMEAVTMSAPYALNYLTLIFPIQYFHKVLSQESNNVYSIASTQFLFRVTVFRVYSDPSTIAHFIRGHRVERNNMIFTPLGYKTFKKTSN